MNLRTLFELGQFELIATISVADMTTCFGRDGTADNFKMVVAIEGEGRVLVMDDITPAEIMAVVALQTFDDSEIEKQGLEHLWVTVQPLLKRIPKEYQMFRPVP